MFAGSAVMFAFTALNGSPLLSTVNETQSIAEPVGSPAITEPGHGAVDSAPGQAGGHTQTTESRYGGPFHGILSGVLRVTKGFSR